VIVAKGPDAKQAVEKLSKLIADGLGDEGCTPVSRARVNHGREDFRAAPRPRSSDPNVLLGVAASPGLAVGTVFQVQRAEIVVEEEGHGVEREQKLLAEAIDKARGQLEALRAQLHSKADPAKAAIFAAHASCSTIPTFSTSPTPPSRRARARLRVEERRRVPRERLASLRNELLAQRANDVRDVGGRVLELLTGVTHKPPTYPEGSILIAEDLTPSDTATMERGRVVGFATVRGGATSHVAILARSLGDSRDRRHRAARARSRQRHARHPRWRERFAAAESAARGDRAHPPAAGAAGSAAQEDVAHAREPAATMTQTHPGLANIGGLKDAEQIAEVGGEGRRPVALGVSFYGSRRRAERDEQPRVTRHSARDRGHRCPS
jgi:phosphocarrier protein FPr